MKELSGTMVEYWDEGEHQRDHEAFKKWQLQAEQAWEDAGLEVWGPSK